MRKMDAIDTTLKTNLLSAGFDFTDPTPLKPESKNGSKPQAAHRDQDTLDDDSDADLHLTEAGPRRQDAYCLAASGADLDAQDGGDDNADNADNSLDLAREIALVKEDNQKKLQAKIEALEQKLEKTEHALHSLELQHSGLQADHETTLQDLALKNRILEDFDKKGRSLTDESQKFLTQIKQLNDKNARLQKRILELQEGSQEERKAQAARERDADAQRKEVTRLQSELVAKGKKIDQLLEDIGRLKATYKAKGIPKENEPDNDQKATERLQDQVKRLEKQRGDLLAVVKKQAQLADVLRRQRANVQSAFL